MQYDDLLSEAEALREEVAGLRTALEQAERALDGAYRSAGQSTAGWLAGRRQIAEAIQKARSILGQAEAKE